MWIRIFHFLGLTNLSDKQVQIYERKFRKKNEKVLSLNQLFLLTSGAIIVGTAIIVGVNMFSESANNANRDALLQDCMTLATRAQQWYRTPSIHGGGGKGFNNITLDAVRFPKNNENGSFTLIPEENQVTIECKKLAKDSISSITVFVTVYPDSIGMPIIVK